MKYIATSPSAPIVVLLHGLIFLFAITYYAGMPWKRNYTIGLYGLALIWGGAIAIQRFRARRTVLNRIDFLFVAFLLAVCISIASHWWEGSIKQVQLMPFFLVAPYILGRTMRAEDGLVLRSMLVFAGFLLLILIIPEYFRYMRYGYPYSDSPYPVLFGKNIGAMMSGLVFTSAIISLTSILLTQKRNITSLSPKSAILRLTAYAGIVLMVFLAVWVGSRGPLLLAIVGVCVLLLTTPRSSQSGKLVVIVVLGISLIVAVAGALQRQASVAHYARLVALPSATTGEIERKVTASKQAVGALSVLGSSECDRIVDSVSDRWVHVRQAVVLALNNPLIGVGANQYGFYACQGPGAFPHNVLLQAFAELGMIVGVVYFYLLWLSIRMPIRLWKSARNNGWKLLSCWLIALSIIQTLFALISGDYFVSAPLYLVMGMAASFCDHVHNETAE